MCAVFKALFSAVWPRPYKYEYRGNQNEYDNRGKKNYLMSAQLFGYSVSI
jgi:hypothetical protein